MRPRPDDLVKTPGDSPKQLDIAGRRSGRNSAYHIPSPGSTQASSDSAADDDTLRHLPRATTCHLGKHCIRTNAALRARAPAPPVSYPPCPGAVARFETLVAGQAPAGVVGQRPTAPGRTGSRPARVRTTDRPAAVFAPSQTLPVRRMSMALGKPTDAVIVAIPAPRRPAWLYRESVTYSFHAKLSSWLVQPCRQSTATRRRKSRFGRLGAGHGQRICSIRRGRGGNLIIPCLALAGVRSVH